MDKDTFSIICLYLEIDQYYKLKKKFNLSILNYCRNVPLYQINYQGERVDLDMNWASGDGYLEVVKYVHETGKDCTNTAMAGVSANGHLEIVKYLHRIGKDCSYRAMNLASQMDI